MPALRASRAARSSTCVNMRNRFTYPSGASRLTHASIRIR